MSRWKILSTKTLDADVKKLLEENDFDITEKDLTRVTLLISNILEQIHHVKDQTVVFTSSNAVNAVKDQLAGIPLQVFCMEGKTQKAVQEKLPAAEIVGTAGNAKAIAEQILKSGVKEVLFFCGDTRREELPVLLTENDVTLKEIVVYETKETPVQINDVFDAAIFFSPSAVRSFFRVNTLSDITICFSIGNTTADEIKNYTSNPIIVADTPSQEVLTTAIIQHFKQMVKS